VLEGGQDIVLELEQFSADSVPHHGIVLGVAGSAFGQKFQLSLA
jgi:hypothetical protein